MHITNTGKQWIKVLLLITMALTSSIGLAKQTIYAPNSESGVVGSIEFGDKAIGSIAGLGDSSEASYHTFTVEVEQGTKRLMVKMKAKGDLDLALKHNAPIDNYGDDADWDLGDNSRSNSATLRIDNPSPGTWYIDVINSSYDEDEIEYELVVL